MTTMTALAPGLPGLSVPGHPEGVLPRTLLATGSLLLAEVKPGETVDLAGHRRTWGTAPDLPIDALVARVTHAEVVGAGGAGFPTARKLASLAGRRVGLVIVNGSEGESASGKDGVLLAHVPHLVLDGAVSVAHALGARAIVVRISLDRPDLADLLPRALAQRTDDVPISLSVGPAEFAAGEATAVIRAVTGGPALPAALGLPPVAPGRWARSAVMVSNVETFARVALAARGIRTQSALMSLSGAVRHPGVVEMPAQSTLAAAAEQCGGLVGRPEVLITGGWHGRWVDWDEATRRAPLTRAGLAGVGGRWGAGAFVWLPEDLDPMLALAAVTDELAAGTAGQCGPCWRGLPEVAREVHRVAAGTGSPVELSDLMRQVDGRGICAHPSAAVAAVRSGLDLVRGS